MATHRLPTIFLLAALCAGAAHTQNARPPVDSATTRQMHQALSQAEHGDRQSAMNTVETLLEQHPEFAPAIKLKGMLLEDSGHPAEAAAAYEQALKLAPNDGDLLLKVGIAKLASGQKEEAIRLLEHCIRILPADGDAHYYLAQAYHLNGQDAMALRAIRLSAKLEPENPDRQGWR